MSNKNTAANINGRMFRDVMGLFATGVTVVTADLEGETHGMTANAITSLSLDPLLVLVCVQKDAMMAGILQQAGAFAISILSADQEHLSNFFAGIWPDGADPPLSALSLGLAEDDCTGQLARWPVRLTNS